MLSKSWKYVPMPASSPHELAAYAMRWCPKPILIVPTYTVPPREDRIARRGVPPAAPPRREIAAVEAESWLTFSLSTKDEGIASSWMGGLGAWPEDAAPKPAVNLIGICPHNGNRFHQIKSITYFLKVQTFVRLCR